MGVFTRSVKTTLLPGARIQHQAVEFLDRPAAVHKTLRQPIEQLRMCRPLAEQAEIIGGTDNPLPKVPTPYAIDHHAAGERVLRVSHPLSQFATAAFHGCKLGRLRATYDRRNM